MAKKAKTPRPPRPVQAPMRRDRPARNGKLPGTGGVPGWVWLVAVGVVAAIVVGVVLATRSGKAAAANVRDTMLAAGCTYRDVTPLAPKSKAYGGFHADVPRLTTSMTGLWNSF